MLANPLPDAPRAPADTPDERPPSFAFLQAIEDRWPGAGRRAVGIALALLLEVALLLLLLTLGQAGGGQDEAGEALTTFTAAADEPPAPEPAQQPRAEPSRALPAPARAPDPEQPQPPVPAPTPVAPPLIPLSKSQMPSAEIGAPKPPAPAKPSGPVGPPNRGSPGDSQRVAGSGPNGEPLYAARWYREPYDDELSGYLSTASGPGWAMINCRTVPDFRVEDCVLEAEQPRGSNIGSAILAAAWQFRVRPPRLGGRSMVGEWVRIRIDYQIRPRPPGSGGF